MRSWPRSAAFAGAGRSAARLRGRGRDGSGPRGRGRDGLRFRGHRLSPGPPALPAARRVDRLSRLPTGCEVVVGPACMSCSGSTSVRSTSTGAPRPRRPAPGEGRHERRDRVPVRASVSGTSACSWPPAATAKSAPGSAVAGYSPSPCRCRSRSASAQTADRRSRDLCRAPSDRRCLSSRPRIERRSSVLDQSGPPYRTVRRPGPAHRGAGARAGLGPGLDDDVPSCGATYSSLAAVAGPDQGRPATRYGMRCWP